MISGSAREPRVIAMRRVSPPCEFCDLVNAWPRSRGLVDARLNSRIGAGRARRVNRLSHRQLWRLLVLCGGLSAALTARPDAVSAVQVLREGGCGGILPAARPLQHNALLDRAAEQWAAGRLGCGGGGSAAATRRRPRRPLHVSGPESSTLQLLRRSGCRTVTDQGLRDIGVYHRGSDTWLVLASAYVVPASAYAAPTLYAASGGAGLCLAMRRPLAHRRRCWRRGR